MTLRRACALEVLLAHRAARGRLADGLQPRELLRRELGIGLGGAHLGLGLRDLLGPAAGLQPQQRLFLHADARLRLRHAQRQGAGVEPADDLAGAHPVALAHREFGHALAAAEGQRYLAQVDVAVEHDAVGRCRRAAEVPGAGGRGGQHDDGEGDQGFLVHGVFRAKAEGAAGSYQIQI